jgi:hypothetical protein
MAKQVFGSGENPESDRSQSKNPENRHGQAATKNEELQRPAGGKPRPGGTSATEDAPGAGAPLAAVQFGAEVGYG